MGEEGGKKLSKVSVFRGYCAAPSVIHAVSSSLKAMTIFLLKRAGRALGGMAVQAGLDFRSLGPGGGKKKKWWVEAFEEKRGLNLPWRSSFPSAPLYSAYHGPSSLHNMSSKNVGDSLEDVRTPSNCGPSALGLLHSDANSNALTSLVSSNTRLSISTPQDTSLLRREEPRNPMRRTHGR